MTLAKCSAKSLASDLSLPQPTDDQARVIEAPLEPVLVVAGAGSGKTATMALRVAYLVANHLVEPGNILGLTFTRKAAGELAERISSYLARLNFEGVDAPNVSTYNSYAASLMRDHALRLGFDPEAELLTEGGAWRLAMEVVEAWPCKEPELAASTLAGRVLSLAAECVGNLTTPAQARQAVEAMAAHFASRPRGVNPKSGRMKGLDDPVKAAGANLAKRVDLFELVENLIELKKQRGFVSYIDQEAIALELVQKRPEIGHGERQRFTTVLLDEYQDSSAIQIKLLSQLYRGHPVMAVGDPNQSIYGWRGASAEGLAGFGRSFADQAEADTTTLTLGMAWRSDRAILDVANAVAKPLRQVSPVKLPILDPKKGASQGQVTAAYFDTDQAEALGIAEYLAREWRDKPKVGSRPRTAAVLCRKRDFFGPVVEALKKAGLEYEVVGTGGLIALPEVQDVLAALRAAHQPDHGEALMRLAAGARYALGLRDLSALGAIAKRSTRQQVALADGPRLEGPDSQISIIDVLDSLDAKQAVAFSKSGWRRLRSLAGALRRIRQAGQLPLAEQVVGAERALGLDIDLMSRRGPTGRVHVEQLVQLAHQFAGSYGGSAVDFLDWLDEEAAQDRGLEPGQVNVNDQAVQVMTIHAAKGLEWDLVVVCGLSETQFPVVAPNRDGQRRDSAYFGAGTGALPWSLRLDSASLPSFGYQSCQDTVELNQEYARFVAKAGEHRLREERRLAYVAVTRPRSRLLLTGSYFGGSRKDPLPPSIFLNELVEEGLVSQDQWAAEPGEGDKALRAEGRSELWPPVPPSEGAEGVHRAAVVTAAGRVRAAMELVGGEIDQSELTGRLSAMDGALASQAALLLREQSRGKAEATLHAPRHFTVTALDSWLQDPMAYAQQIRRPMPQPPQASANVGTLFHQQVEALLWAGSGQGELGLEEAADSGSDDPDSRRVAKLVEKFKQSKWVNPSSGLKLVATEHDLAVRLSGTVLRGRVDAIFEDQTGHLVVVDWKTGSENRSHLDQLRRYRAMLALHQDVDPSTIRAVAHYAGTGKDVEAGQAEAGSAATELAAQLKALGA
ncbi:MAG: ATP-dependent helicase [Micrococcales bacterium]|nr:ATP-dependent helicase [Micrococcales bacterium]